MTSPYRPPTAGPTSPTVTPSGVAPSRPVTPAPVPGAVTSGGPATPGGVRPLSASSVIPQVRLPVIPIALGVLLVVATLTVVAVHFFGPIGGIVVIAVVVVGAVLLWRYIRKRRRAGSGLGLRPGSRPGGGLFGGKPGGLFGRRPGGKPGGLFGGKPGGAGRRNPFSAMRSKIPRMFGGTKPKGGGLSRTAPRGGGGRAPSSGGRGGGSGGGRQRRTPAQVLRDRRARKAAARSGGPTNSSNAPKGDSTDAKSAAGRAAEVAKKAAAAVGGVVTDAVLGKDLPPRTTGGQSSTEQPQDSAQPSSGGSMTTTNTEGSGDRPLSAAGGDEASFKAWTGATTKFGPSLRGMAKTLRAKATEGAERQPAGSALTDQMFADAARLDAMAEKAEAWPGMLNTQHVDDLAPTVTPRKGSLDVEKMGDTKKAFDELSGGVS